MGVWATDKAYCVAGSKKEGKRGRTTASVPKLRVTKLVIKSLMRLSMPDRSVSALD